jgi:hypothetical protein
MQHVAAEATSFPVTKPKVFAADATIDLYQLRERVPLRYLIRN